MSVWLVSTPVTHIKNDIHVFKSDMILSTLAVVKSAVSLRSRLDP